MHKNFSFKGVVRSNDNILANDGECIELVNLRTVNGSLRPIPEFTEKAVLQGKYSDIYWHSKVNCYLCVNKNEPRGVDFYNKNWNTLVTASGAKLNFPSLSKVRKIEFTGYVAVCMTDDGIRYLLYADGTYRWLGEAPAVPALSVTYSSAVYKVNTDVTFTTASIDTSISSLWQYNSRGYFDECISRANKAGYYIDRALFRFALRLYDGSYIYTSHVILVNNDSEIDGIKRDAGNLVAKKNDESANESTYRASVLGFKPQFNFYNLNLKNWEGVIVGIDLFTTGSVMGNKLTETMISVFDTGTKQRTSEKVEVYKSKTADELWSDVNDASLFYKVAEFSISGVCQNSVDDVSQANIVLQDTLSSFEQRPTMSSVIPGCSYMFNNRLHVASLRESLFKGYDVSSMLPVGIGSAVLDGLAVQTRIKTRNGVSTVLNYYENIYIGYYNGKYQLPPLLSYPDSRAYEMSIFICYDTEWFRKKLPLTPHKYLEQSQYLHKYYFGYAVSVKAVFANGGTVGSIPPETAIGLFGESVGTHEVVYSKSMGGWTYKGDKFPPDEYSSLRVFAIPVDIADGDKIVFTITESGAAGKFWDIRNITFDSTWEVVGGPDDFMYEENIYETKENVMKVSLLENPFVFPAKCTYPLPQGKVTALSTNSVAMSEGQFGEHPLYVFSQEGIQVMAVDATGATAYSNVYPVSHEVCLNSRMVCGTDSGVLFLGTQGVMLIAGNRCIRLSVAMDKEGNDSKVLERNGVIGQIAALHGLDGVVDAECFLDFMREARVAHHATMDELIFVNGSYGYSYVYSVPGNVWSKINRAFDGFVWSGGMLAMFRNSGNKTGIYLPGDNISGGNCVLLVTRPHPFGTKLPKRIMQLMLHASLSKRTDDASSSAFVSCFLLCSNDGVLFKLVAGCEKKNDSQDICFPYFPTQSYRYFVFALAGNLDAMSMITGLELDVNPAWNNRLR